MSADNKNVFAKTGVAVLKAWVKNYRLHQFFTNKIKAEIKFIYLEEFYFW